MKGNPLVILTTVAQIVYNKKGFNALALDVQGLSTITDFLFIAEGNVDRHITAMAHAIMDGLKEMGEEPLHTEGLKGGDWIVLDYGQLMIHLFSPGLRDKYSLERLWKESKIVDVEIDLSKAIGDKN